MGILRYILSFYRKKQYNICKRYFVENVPAGVECYHEPFEEENNHGDVLHPCVRCIPNGYLGHKWWMVYTPYCAAYVLIYQVIRTKDALIGEYAKQIAYRAGWDIVEIKNS